MKYLVIILLISLVSCKEQTENGAVSTTNNVEISKSSISTSEISQTQEIVKVVDYNGLKPLLEKRNDTTYVVNFWATWCKPCVEELPAFEKLKNEFDKEKVKVVLVSLDFPDKLEKQVLPFIKKNNLKSDIILLDDADANSWIPAIDETWSGAIPASIIYNKNKRTFYEQSFTFEELKKEVKSIL